MDCEGFKRLMEHRKQARAAVQEIMHMENIKIRCGDLGNHYAIWVIWADKKGKQQSRQFSWDKQNPGHDGLRMQWMWDAFWEYHKAKEAILNSYWEEIRQEFE